MIPGFAMTGSDCGTPPPTADSPYAEVVIVRMVQGDGSSAVRIVMFPPAERIEIGPLRTGDPGQGSEPRCRPMLQSSPSRKVARAGEIQLRRCQWSDESPGWMVSRS